VRKHRICRTSFWLRVITLLSFWAYIYLLYVVYWGVVMVLVWMSYRILWFSCAIRAVPRVLALYFLYCLVVCCDLKVVLLLLWMNHEWTFKYFDCIVFLVYCLMLWNEPHMLFELIMLQHQTRVSIRRSTTLTHMITLNYDIFINYY
jgi:hypothetical protein